ncbi:hypothetical protein BGZ80_005969 [Entomortierella chlamydospora]|uniref:Uncharacterized protein n=1 Tax=Entomortierella chlamydospora TaxID=101097 RepID=A0A9P6SU17_9FUNG|nr:hypothetical protein BGZ79_002888 [Entomortierella chlamydospora]KAG0002487.1 hypothetical protein BGZ80_005969 [Entomortierella chlamydospora]
MPADKTSQMEDVKRAKRTKQSVQARKPSKSPVQPIQPNQPTQVAPIQAATRAVRPRKKNRGDQNSRVDFFSLSGRRREKSIAVDGSLSPLGWCGKYARELDCAVCLGKPAISSVRCLSYPDVFGGDFRNASRDAGNELRVSESDPEENAKPETESPSDAFGDSAPAEQVVIDSGPSEDSSIKGKEGTYTRNIVYRNVLN